MSRFWWFGLFGCGALLLILTGLGLAAQQQDDIGRFVWVALAQGAVYLAALWFALRRGPPRSRSWHGVAVILGIAAAMRAAVLLAPPYLSTDIYRYVWDGRVIAAGINPYRYIPTDPHLAALRDPDIFPNINRNNYAPTIYPPAAETLFFAVTRISERLVAMRAAMVVLEAAAVALLLALLARSGRPATRIIVYAWHPLPLWEFAGSGHIDALIVACVALALWGRQRGSFSIAGLALAGGVLAKFYPATLLPALWRRWDWRLPAVFTAAVILAYLPFVGVGWRVFGFLPGYLSEEGFVAGGAGFYLGNIAKSVLPPGAAAGIGYIAVALCLLAGLALFVAFGRHQRNGEAGAAALLAGAFMLLLSPHYPWYFAWLLVFACAVPSAALVWLTLASILLYLVPVGSQVSWDRQRFLVESVLYLPFLMLAASDLWRHRRREQADNGADSGR